VFERSTSLHIQRILTEKRSNSLLRTSENWNLKQKKKKESLLFYFSSSMHIHGLLLPCIPQIIIDAARSDERVQLTSRRHTTRVPVKAAAVHYITHAVLSPLNSIDHVTATTNL
jgi:hypothetical protein